MKDVAPLLKPTDLTQMFLTDETKLRIENPIAWTHLRSLYSLYQKVEKKSADQARRAIADWLHLTTGEKIEKKYLYENFGQAIAAVKDFKQALIREFVPDAIRFPFTSDGIINPTIDPAEILTIIWRPPGDERYRRMRSFVALVYWHLGIRFLMMRIHHKDYSRQLSGLTLWLEKNLFVAEQVEKPYRENITVRYDPANLNRFAGLGACDETQNCLTLALWYRFINTENRLIKVLYDSRIKKEEDNFRKTLVQSKAELPINNDACGITMVFFSRDDLNAAYERMTEPHGIFGNGAVISNVKINGHGGKRRNEYSSTVSPPEMQFLVYVQGEVLEVQLFIFDHYFNRKLSFGPENHHLYRLQQSLPLLKLLFPADLFVDWDNPNIIKLIEALQTAKIAVNYPITHSGQPT